MKNQFSIDAVRAVIFDFDGTLADSYDAIAASVNHVRSEYDLPPIETEQIRLHVGRGLLYLLEQTIPGGNPESDQHIYRDHHPSIMKENTRLLPGAAESLSAIKQTGRAIGVCSNKPSRFTKVLLKDLGFGELIDAVFGPDDVENAKPAPDMLLACMKQLDAEPQQTLYVGDMTVDIETARAANVTVWVVPTGSETLQDLRKAEPDRVLESLLDLVEIFPASP